MSDTRSWLDRADYLDQIERKRGSGEISSEEAEQLVQFAREGYLVVRLEHDGLDRLVAEIDRFWRERPNDLACAGPDDRFLRRMDEVDPGRMRGPAGRIHDSQSHSSPARELYLHPLLHRMAELIFGSAPVAINSILFEYGSGQELHRDQQYVPVSSDGQLAAAWIALEDIDPMSGPLAYIPGSHRLPDSAVDRGQAVTFTPRKGEVLFWHAKLYHGGEPVRDRSRTRKSFVIHFSTFDEHPYVARTIVESDRPRIVGTQRIMREGRRRGFANPLSRRGTDWPATIARRIRFAFGDSRTVGTTKGD